MKEHALPHKNRPSLNSEQESAANAPLGPRLIVAGAGTGKTRTLISRIAHLLHIGIPKESICAITFTNKAAREMEERAIASLHDSGAGKESREQGWFIGTFHSLGARILRAEARYLGRRAGFAIFDDSDSLQLSRKIVKEMELSKSDPGTAALLSGVSRIKNGSTPLSLISGSRRREDVVLTRFFDSYEKRLRDNNAFDFDYLIVKVVQL